MKKEKIIFLLVFLIFLESIYLYNKLPKGKLSGEVKSETSQNKQDSSLLSDFKGEKGNKIISEAGIFKLPETSFNGSQVHFYNTDINGKTIFFFVAKDKNGIFRAAANACQVCFSAKKGFHQEGDFIVCNNCGNRYPLEKIATEKGGCNPIPINPNLEINSGNVIINETDLQKATDSFSG